jgi:hypothetical protein
MEIMFHNVHVDTRILTRMSTMGFKVNQMVRYLLPTRITVATFPGEAATKERFRTIVFGADGEELISSDSRYLNLSIALIVVSPSLEAELLLPKCLPTSF